MQFVIYEKGDHSLVAIVDAETARDALGTIAPYIAVRDETGAWDYGMREFRAMPAAFWTYVPTMNTTAGRTLQDVPRDWAEVGVDDEVAP